ncbi:MAG: hypothetical protein LAP38_07095 [Acidobacteriia bacterium]|nr:hypothetical protein [Terriglobia bacterium]
MAANPPVPPPPDASGSLAPARKSSALKWILIGVGGFFLICILSILALGVFVVNKAKQAGLDPDLIKRNPALAAAKLAVAANPKVEIVSANEGRQEITIRDKDTGKLMTMSFEDAKQGKFVFKENGKEALTITSSGSGGALEMKSADGSVRIGGSAKAPAWVPDYPGSEPQGAFAARGQDGEGGSFAFKTKDASGKVVKYYQDQFQSGGLKVTSNITSQNGESSAGVLAAEDAANKHTITVIVGQDGGETTVSVSYATNK